MEELNLEEFESQFEEAWEETDPEPDAEPESKDDGDEQQGHDSLEGVETEDDVDPEFPEEKQNKAFQQMRKDLQDAQNKLSETSKYEKLIQTIAEKNGTTPEQIIKDYEAKQLENAAKEQNLPVEYLQKQKKLEQEISNLKNQTVQEQLKGQITELKEKYGVEDQEKVREVMKFMDDNKIPLTVSLADGYFLMNKDTIIAEQIKADRQKQLQEEKEKRNKSTNKHDSSSSNKRSDVLTEDEFYQILKDTGTQI